MLGEFEVVMQENRNSMKITEQKQWWSRRRALDTQLQVSPFLFIHYTGLGVVLKFLKF